MSEWDSTGQDGHDSGPRHEPGEDRGQASWFTQESTSAQQGADRRADDPPRPGADRRHDAPTTPPPPTTPGADRRAGDPPPPRSDRRHDAPTTPPPPAPASQSGSPWASAETYVSVPVPPIDGGTAGPTPLGQPGWTPPQQTPSYGAGTGSTAGPRGAGRALAVIAVLVVAVGTALGVWYVGRGDDTGPAARGSAGGGAGVSASGSSDGPSASTLGSSPPSGYRAQRDPVGYTLNVPDGWQRRQKHGEKAMVVFYDAPSDGRQLQIFELSESTPAESLDLAENADYGYSHQPGYQSLDRTSGDSWAELSYRYDDRDKGARQVIDHRFQAADGTLYAIRSSGPEDLPAAEVRTPLDAAVASFCPTGASCG
ncbi:hypothetical protein [Streptomyces sp. NPDC054794]